MPARLLLGLLLASQQPLMTAVEAAGAVQPALRNPPPRGVLAARRRLSCHSAARPQTALSLAQAIPETMVAAGAGLVERRLFDFRGKRSHVDELLRRWQRVDDQIMGGISQSNIVGGPLTEDERRPYASFRGVCRVEGGGFCGSRTNRFETALDLSNNTGLYLLCRGDGNRYKFNVRTSEKISETLYQASFDPPKADFGIVRIPFSAFRQVKRSAPVPGAPPLPPSEIYQLGLVLSRFEGGEEQFNPHFTPGPFSLDIAEIGVYRDPRQHASWVDGEVPLGRIGDEAGGKVRTIVLPPEADSKDLPPGPPRWVKLWMRLKGKKPLRRRVSERRRRQAKTLLEARRNGTKLSEIRRNGAVCM